jgi:hypothetical protein
VLGLSTALGDAAWGRWTGMEGGAVMDDEEPMTDAEHMTHTHELLTHAAQRAQDRPAYVAWALARMQARERLSDEVLAAWGGSRRWTCLGWPCVCGHARTSEMRTWRRSPVNSASPPKPWLRSSARSRRRHHGGKIPPLER